MIYWTILDWRNPYRMCPDQNYFTALLIWKRTGVPNVREKPRFFLGGELWVFVDKVVKIHVFFWYIIGVLDSINMIVA